MKSLAAVRTPTRCRFVIADPSTEGNHGRNLLEIAIKGQFLLQGSREIGANASQTRQGAYGLQLPVSDRTLLQKPT